MDLNTCPFCMKSESSKFDRPLLFESKFFFAIKDIYPVTDGHSLIISKEHKKDFFDLSIEEKADLNESVEEMKSILDREYNDLTGYNIGMNCGASAGQTVFHFHLHLIPRRDHDCDAPQGGVRGVISGKQSY